MNVKKIKKNYLGFSLIELVVAMSIMAIITTIVLTNFNQGNKSRAVSLAADSVMSAIRTAETLSQNPKAINGSPCAPDNTPKEYHLVFDVGVATSVDLVAYEICGATTNTTTLETFKLPQKTQIRASNSLQVGGGSDPGLASNMEIKFSPPFANMSVSRNGGTYSAFNQVVITLESTDSSATRSVILSGISGLVDKQ